MIKPLGYLLDKKGEKEMNILEIGYFHGIGEGLKERPICNICNKIILKGENFKIYYEQEEKKIKHSEC